MLFVNSGRTYTVGMKKLVLFMCFFNFVCLLVPVILCLTIKFRFPAQLLN